MTKMEKIATVVALLECAFIGYVAKRKFAEMITEHYAGFFEKEAKRVAARQRQKFYKNATESNEEI